jgi:DNA-cytosine methyltransferase
MRVLSLFDGISCGKIALDRANIKYSSYYASEINKDAIKVSKDNNVDVTYVGDVRTVQAKNFPTINLLMEGSPCQGFSKAGRDLNFLDANSKLFFEFVRLLKETSPDYFLLENVFMKKDYIDTITKYLGVDPIMINSSVVSAQSRKRLYWTNIIVNSSIPVSNIYLKDIVEQDPTDVKIINVSSSSDMKFIPVTSHYSKTGLVCLGGIVKNTHKMWSKDGKLLQRNFSMGNRVYSEQGKTTTLNANSGGLGSKTGLYKIGNIIRTLPRLECERLQTVPEGYTKCVSKNKAVSLLGNGWTADVIAHILKHIK